MGVVKVAGSEPAAFTAQARLLLPLACGMLGALISDLEGRKAEEESAAKSRFMAVMSHELRTPMNAILGFAQLLEMSASDALSDKQMRHLRNISESGRHLMRLIEDLLALSLLDGGGFALANEHLALDEVVREGADRVREICRDKGLELILETAPTEVLGDRRRLLEIVENLLSNAVKFTERGGHILIVVGSAGGEARLSVSDDGMGIAPEDRNRIFERFVQLDGGRTRGGVGAGIGLTLSRAYAERMGGRLEVTSTPGDGSCFEVFLPPSEQAAR